MDFIVVGIKGKDHYVLYDTVNKGVACCTGYTIKQLIQDYNCRVIGAKLSADGKLAVQEMTLQGQVRGSKAPVICKDETKRSAVTIAKGLPVNKYSCVDTRALRSTGLGSKVITCRTKVSWGNSAVGKEMKVFCVAS